MASGLNNEIRVGLGIAIISCIFYIAYLLAPTPINISECYVTSGPQEHHLCASRNSHIKVQENSQSVVIGSSDGIDYRMSDCAVYSSTSWACKIHRPVNLDDRFADFRSDFLFASFPVEQQKSIELKMEKVPFFQWITAPFSSGQHYFLDGKPFSDGAGDTSDAAFLKFQRSKLDMGFL